jgi:hypothetical protein
VVVVRHSQRWHRDDQLVAQAQRRPAGDQDTQVRAPVKHEIDELGGRLHEVLTVVQQDEGLPRPQELSQDDLRSTSQVENAEGVATGQREVVGLAE